MQFNTDLLVLLHYHTYTQYSRNVPTQHVAYGTPTGTTTYTATHLAISQQYQHASGQAGYG